MLFLLIFYNATVSSFSHTPERVRTYDDGETYLREAITTRRSKTASDDAKAKAKQNLGIATRTIERIDISAATSARLLLAMEHESGYENSAKAIELLRKSKDPVDRCYLAIYTESFARGDLDRILNGLPKSGYLPQAAKIHASEKVGVAVPVADRKNLALVIIGGLALVTIIGAGFLSLATFLYGRQQGTIQPLGLKLGRISLFQADLLAIRAAQVFLTYEFVLILTGLLIHDRLLGALVSLLVIPAIALVSHFNVGGWRLNLRDIGLSTIELPQSFLKGGFTFLAEFPVSLALLLLATTVSRFLPKAVHPLSTQLANDHSPVIIISGLVSAAVLAPFVEEIVFRGLLFPAFARLTQSPIWGAIISSVLFAAMHPQGVALWLPLASIGLFSCALSYYTRSLMPSIFMHGLHNGITLVLALLAS